MRDNNTIQSMSETAEIDLLAVLWRMLRQWKCVLIVAIVFGLLASVALNLRSAGGGEIPQDEVSLTESLEEEEKLAVETVVLEERQLEDVLVYLDRSVIMKRNTMDYRVLELQYYIEPDEELPARQRALLRRSYVNAVRSDLMYDALEESGAFDASKDYPHDMISVSYEVEADYVLSAQDETSRSDVFAIVISLEDGMDEKLIEDTVTEFLKARTSALVDRFGKHHMEHLFSYTNTRSDYDASSRKYAMIQQVYNMRGQIASLKGAFTDKQMAYYMEIVEERGLIGELTEEQQAELDAFEANQGQQSTSGSWFSKKYFAVGFVLGVVLYAVFLVLHMMRKRRIDSPASLGAAGYRIFGDVYRYGTRSAITDSKFFYGLAHRGKTDVQNALDRIGDAVAATAEHAGFREISLMPLGDASGIADLLDGLKKTLADAGIVADISPLYTDGKDAGSDQAFLNQKPVVPVVLGERTTTEMVDALAMRCRNYDVELPGVIFAG